MAANMYRVGDYVYFETSSTTPYQIRRIEELNKTPNGNVEAKVMCFFRRRDISSSLTLLADKHQNMLEDSEIEAREEDVSEKQKHQLKHRELFLSRQVETLPATHIRGKCVVTLLNETESLLTYLNKDDTFFYSLVYDPSQRTLLADKGEIRVGSRYQAESIPSVLADVEDDDRKMEDLEELIWTPENGLSIRQVDQFLIIARSVGTFARALDCTSTVRQPSLHMSAAAASRDITLFHAMDTLHKASYDTSKGANSLVPSGGPVLCRDEMEEWSASEANLFEEALQKYGKDFNDIRQDFLPWKSLKCIIEYYYMWKTTDRYVQQKRIKAAEAESKLKQVYIPNYNKPNPAAIDGTTNGMDGQVSGRACESCYAAHSGQWYSWGPAHMQCRLCSSCWIYWKKYGGLKMPTRLDGERPAPTQRQERIAQFNSMRMQKCTIGGCGKEFRLKAHLARHLATAHGLMVRSGSPRPVMKTRAAFCLVTTSLTRISRRLCSDILNPHRAARSPFIPINIAAIKQECQLRLAEEGKYVPQIRPRGKATLDPVVAKLGINITVEKPALLLRSENDHKKPERLAFPRIASQPQQWFNERYNEAKMNSASLSPSIMKKRGYEQTNGIDGQSSRKLCPPSKRPNMGVIRQIGSVMRHTMRGNVMNHHMNGRGRMQMINWIDAPDDVYFVATEATRKIRRQLNSHDFKRTARNPWRQLPIKPLLHSDVVVLD